MSSESQPEKKMKTLQSNDGETLEAEEAVALQSETVKRLIEFGYAGATPSGKVPSLVLSKVLEYCKKHAEPGNNEKDLQDWDKKFLEVDLRMLYELIMAAYHLNVKGLYDLTCRAVANMIKGKTTKEIRTILNIKNDFDIFEEWEILMQNQWAIRTIEM